MFGARFLQLTDMHDGMIKQVAAGRFIGQQAVQLHGGMGVTDELPAAHYFKRLAMIEPTLGDSDHRPRRFMAAPDFRPATPEPTWSNT